MISIDRRFFLEILKGLAFALTVIGFVLSVLPTGFPLNRLNSITLIMLVTVFYIAITVWAGRSERANHQFDPESAKEGSFFKKWYSKNGILKIFCNDLLWLEKRRDVVDILILKGESECLHLYLRDLNGEALISLFNSGAHIYKVKERIKSLHRFSILNDEGIKSIIIRNKEVEKKPKIEFQEFRDHPAIVNLAEDMLDDCYEEAIHKSTHRNLASLHKSK